MHEYDLDYLKECVYEDCGILYWKSRPYRHFAKDSKCEMFNTKYAGLEAGNVSKRGYKKFSLSGKYYLCHRVIFLLYNGYLPNLVDHEDTNKLNNIHTNLRDATHKENNQNSKSRKGSSKYKGVSWSMDKQKWRVYCSTSSYKQRYVGQSNSEITAARMYDKAVAELYGEFAWLNKDHFEEVKDE